MKILFLHNYFHVKSGSNVVMFEEAKLLKQKGHKVYYFCTNKKPYYDENYEFLDYFPEYINLSDLNFKKSPLNFFRAFYNPEAVKKFGMLLDKIKPDIVQEHTTSFNLTHAILKECHKRKIPVFITIHGPSYFCPTGNLLFKKERFCENINCKGLNKFHCIYNKCYEGSLIKQLYKILVYTFYNICGFHKKSSGYICPSNAIHNLAIKAGLPKEKLFTVDNFINLPPEISINKEDSGNYFLYAGRLVKEKGIYNLIETWKNLPEEIELHIVGTGEEENKLKKLIHKYNLNNVKLKGFKDKKDLQKEYKSCIASILPSIGFEAFGLTILESFCFNKPVIASEIGGIPEIIINNKNGILIEPGNNKKLQEAVMKLYKNPALRKKLGINGRKTAETRFSPQTHYDKLINVYEKFSRVKQ